MCISLIIPHYFYIQNHLFPVNSKYISVAKLHKLEMLIRSHGVCMREFLPRTTTVASMNRRRARSLHRRERSRYYPATERDHNHSDEDENNMGSSTLDNLHLYMKDRAIKSHGTMMADEGQVPRFKRRKQGIQYRTKVSEKS